MADKDKLTFPRVVYRGKPDHLGTGSVGETKRVEDKSEYDAAIADGWRQHRRDGKPVVADDRGTIKIPAQDVIVDSASAKDVLAARERAHADAQKDTETAERAKAHADDDAKTRARAEANQPPPARNSLGGPKK